MKDEEKEKWEKILERHNLSVYRGLHRNLWYLGSSEDLLRYIRSLTTKKVTKKKKGLS